MGIVRELPSLGCALKQESSFKLGVKLKKQVPLSLRAAPHY